MSWAARDWAREQWGIGHPGPLSPGAKLVLFELGDRANKQTLTCFPGAASIAQNTGLTERAVYAALNQLTKIRLIKREARRRRDGTRTSDLYTLKIPALWLRAWAAEQRRRLPEDSSGEIEVWLNAAPPRTNGSQPEVSSPSPPPPREGSSGEPFPLSLKKIRELGSAEVSSRREGIAA